MNNAAYTYLRSKIKSGHIVFFGAQTWKQKIVTLFTGGKFSHCGIAVWLTDGVEDRLMLIEATHGGRRVVSLSSYANRFFNVLDVGLKYSDIATDIMSQTGAVPYGNLDFVKIGLKDLMLKFGIKTMLPDSPGEVCSEFVAETLAKAGFPLQDCLISPSDLYKELHTPVRLIVEYKP